MKIGIDIRAIGRQRTGDESYTLGLVQALEETDQKNQYLLYTDTNNKGDLLRIEKKLGLSGKNFKIVPVLPKNKMLWTFFSLPRYIKRNPVDILHVQYITPFWLPKRTKLITTIHDISFIRYPQFIGWKDLFFLKVLIPQALKRADKIIAVSEFTKKELIDCYATPEDKIETVYNVINKDNLIEPTKEQLENLKKKHGLFNPFLFYLGTLQPRKNIPFLLKTFVKLKNDFAGDQSVDSLELVIAGNQLGHNYDRQIDIEIGRIKLNNPEIAQRIKFLGFVSDKDIPAFFGLAKIFVFPSLYEGFGIPLLEAMKHKTPVICSNSSCHKEIASTAALFYKEGQENDLSEKIWQLLNDQSLRSELIQKGEERAKLFSGNQIGIETKKIYEKLVQEKDSI